MKLFKDFLNEKEETLNEARNITPNEIIKASAKTLDELESFLELAHDYDEQVSKSDDTVPEISKDVLGAIRKAEKEFDRINSFIQSEMKKKKKK